MFYETLKFITQYLNQVLRAAGSLGGEDILEWGNIAQLEMLTPSPDEPLENRIVLSLVNLEEEKTLRNGKTVIDSNKGNMVHQPPLFLNLYLLFSMRFSSYDNAIRHLSNLIQYFQVNTILTPSNAPTMPAGLEKLVFELVNLSFEQQNNLWMVFGGKHYPSVLYKVRLIRILELPVQTAPSIQQILSNENNVIY